MIGGVIRVGTSGWTYEQWRGHFYPKGLRREAELGYAAAHLKAIEINGTFYGLQSPQAFAGWAEQVPAEFMFSIKAPRQITHVLRLRDAHSALANFIASGLLRLGIHLGPILWQFPANFRFDPKRLEPFLCLLPHDTEAAAALGRRHDGTLRAPPWLEVGSVRPIRHAFEIQHESFQCQEFIDLLRAHDVALVCADNSAWPHCMEMTSDFVYCRLHMPPLYEQGGAYDNRSLDQWARRINVWAGGEPSINTLKTGARTRLRHRDVFVIFDSQNKIRAPVNAMELMRRLR